MKRLILAAIAAILLMPPPATSAGAANLRPFEGPPMVRQAAALVQPVERTLTVSATAYCLSGTTATGARVGPGTVAVWPPQIPLGSHLWVQGYGYAKALDTGSAITAGHVDLWMSWDNHCAAAWAWGRRTVTVEVLGRPYLSRAVPPRLRAADVRYVRGKAA